MTTRILIISPSKERAIKYLKQKIGTNFDKMINYDEKNHLLLNLDWVVFTWLPPDWRGCGCRVDVIYVDELFPIS